MLQIGTSEGISEFPLFDGKFVKNKPILYLCKAWWIDHEPVEIGAVALQIFMHSFHILERVPNNVSKEKSEDIT